jgi:iron complex outermembrane receptor protein
VLFPPGAFGGAFVDGMIGNPYKWERHERLSATAAYTGFDAHRLRFGIGYVHQDLYRARETKNFNPDFSPIGSGSRADVTDVTDTVPFARPHDRTALYGYAQDEWNFARDWTLTAGVRYDRYSDFGGTTNPRLAVVWEAAYNMTAKLLYGSAFRAPAFQELYLINNPVFICAAIGGSWPGGSRTCKSTTSRTARASRATRGRKCRTTRRSISPCARS